jgi:hypothetical protein
MFKFVTSNETYLFNDNNDGTIKFYTQQQEKSDNLSEQKNNMDGILVHHGSGMYITNEYVGKNQKIK